MSAEKFMRRAIALAERGIGFTKTNPLVGCVIVRNGEIIGEGWHEHFGGPHAEVQAIRNAEENGFGVRGADVFVTLEPCAHQGKTPPCVDLLLEKKVSAVHVLFPDPNPLVSGKSLQKLQEHGVPVSTDFENLRTAHFDLIEDFSYWITAQKPFVALKMASDRDGYIAADDSGKTQIGGAEQQYFTHWLRQKYAAILVGVQTVLTDDPHLGVRLGDFYQGRRDPLRIVFDPHFRLTRNFQMFRDENFLVVTTAKNVSSAEKIFGARVLSLPLLQNSSFDLENFGVQIWERGVPSILVEGGAKTAQSFVDQKQTQKGYFFLSPKKISAEGKGVRGIDFQNIPGFTLQRKRELGADVLWEGNLFSQSLT